MDGVEQFQSGPCSGGRRPQAQSYVTKQATELQQAYASIVGLKQKALKHAQEVEEQEAFANSNLEDSNVQHREQTAALQSRLDASKVDILGLRACNRRHLATNFDLKMKLHASEDLVQELLMRNLTGSYGSDQYTSTGFDGFQQLKSPGSDLASTPDCITTAEESQPDTPVTLGTEEEQPQETESETAFERALRQSRQKLTTKPINLHTSFLSASRVVPLQAAVANAVASKQGHLASSTVDDISCQIPPGEMQLEDDVFPGVSDCGSGSVRTSSSGGGAGGGRRGSRWSSGSGGGALTLSPLAEEAVANACTAATLRSPSKVAGPD